MSFLLGGTAAAVWHVKASLVIFILRRENRGEGCGGKSLAVDVIHRDSSRPTISKQEAITISSAFSARPFCLSLLFISPLFLFCSSRLISHFYSRSVTLLCLCGLFPLPWFTLVLDTSIAPPPSALMNVDPSEECHPA